MADDDTTARLSQPVWELALQAVGGPRVALAKAVRLGAALAGYLDGAELDARLGRLRRAGIIDVTPARVQLACGSVDMLRFWISPAAAEYYQQRGISNAFHQALRFLEEPASLIDPVGFFSERDAIIGHLMQVVHANPVYDLQLLGMFDDGLDELEAQIAQVLQGRHPRAASIAAVVEEPDYHRRLGEFVAAWRRDPATPPMLRSNVASSERWRSVERTFGTLPAAMRYFARLPDTPFGAARHLLIVREFPEHLGEPA